MIDPVEAFQTSVATRHGAAQNRLLALANAWLIGNAPDKKKTLEECLRDLEHLNEILAPSVCPSVLSSLLKDLTSARAMGDSGTAYQYILRAIERRKEFNDWNIRNVNTTSGLDFDQIYQHHRAQNRIPELFNELIDLLTKILNSEDATELRGKDLRQLEELVATLKRNKNGSQNATRGTVHMVTVFLKYLALELGAELPIAGPFIKAAERTAEELSASVSKADDEFLADVNARTNATITKRLTSIQKQIPRLGSPGTA